jgi:hypothetical protein
MGKTWSPGKGLGKFIAATFGVSVKAQVEIVEAISDAVSGHRHINCVANFLPMSDQS